MTTKMERKKEVIIKHKCMQSMQFTKLTWKLLVNSSNKEMKLWSSKVSQFLFKLINKGSPNKVQRFRTNSNN